MKIGIKISLSIAIIITVFSAGLFLSVHQTREAMIEKTGQSVITLSQEIADRLDQRVFSMISVLQIIALDPEIKKLVIESNQEFDRIEDIDSHLTEKVSEWNSFAGKENPIFNEMVKNPMSQKLEEFRQLFFEAANVDLFPEILITNKYGATIAENNRTTDWNQSDRLQFQNSRDVGLHVSDLYYDSSAEIWALEIAIAIKDGDEFAGMLKTTYNIEDIRQIFRDSVEGSIYETSRFGLISGSDKIISAVGMDIPIGFDYSKQIEFYDARNLKEGTYFGVNPVTGVNTIVAYATSDGFRNFSGLNWIVGQSINEDEFLSDVNQLQNILFIIMIISIIIGSVTGFVMIRGIVPPIVRVEKAAKAISEERFDETIDVNSKDEVGSLAKSMTEMAKKLKNAQKEKEEFVAMITHDLKQPLVPISGNAEMLQNPKMGELNEMQKDCVSEIAANANKQLAMIDNLVSAQKLGAGAMTYDTEELSTKNILTEAIKTHTPAMTDKHIEYFDSSTIDVKVLGDNRRIQESYTNLILNAHDFVPQGGKIEIGVTNGDKEVTFFCKDNGEGIPKDKQSQLFKKYGQVKSEAKRKFGGTGLGLAVAQELVEGMGGKIWVESEEGKGSNFLFTIPKTD